MNLFARAFRATMQQIAAFTSSLGGYNAGKMNRLTKNYARLFMPENKIPASDIEQLRGESWNLYRNNPYARKIVRTLETKVIGRGMHPQSQATHSDGTPHVEFRRKSRQLWWSLANCCDVHGKPGRGGLDLVEMQKLALRQVILFGETLARPKILTSKQQQQLGTPIRLAMHLISAGRLSDEKADSFADGNDFYRGIELDADGRRVAYHLTGNRLDEMAFNESEIFRVPAEDILHLFVQEDIDQLRGTPWFAPAIFQARDTGDYQYNVLKASAIAACFVAGYSLTGGKTRVGLAGEGTSDTLTDDDGNQISKLQPGMLINLGKDGKLEAISPAQPTTNAEAFIQHMLRGTGAAMPGIKASTITGDYRNSSFSSERSADNDCWPEMEGVQDWFASAFLQPWYEQVITTAVASGLFSGIVDQDEFAERRSEFLDTNWSGPVPRSINPTDDAKSAQMRIANGQSTPQIECAAIGRDPQDVIAELSEWMKLCEAAGLPDWFIASSMGQTKQPIDPAAQGAANAEQTSSAA